MRLFIGIKLDDKTRQGLSSALKVFNKCSSPLKWVKLENIHLTLKFLGEVSEEKVKPLCQSMVHIGNDLASFTLKIRGFGTFGRKNDIRILWTGITHNSQLENLHAVLDNQLAQLGYQKEERPFSPHLTVGRNKKKTVFNFRKILDIIEENRSISIADLKVKSFQVFQSTLTPEGPIYKILQEIQLGKT